MFSVKNKQQTILLINKIQNERNREKGNVLREIIRHQNEFGTDIASTK
jgi:hypothetical protein